MDHEADLRVVDHRATFGRWRSYVRPRVQSIIAMRPIRSQSDRMRTAAGQEV
jgi:hypothetical protein